MIIYLLFAFRIENVRERSKRCRHFRYRYTTHSHKLNRQTPFVIVFHGLDPHISMPILFPTLWRLQNLFWIRNIFFSWTLFFHSWHESILIRWRISNRLPWLSCISQFLPALSTQVKDFWDQEIPCCWVCSCFLVKYIIDLLQGERIRSILSM